MSEYRKYILIGFIIGFAFFTIMNRGEKMKPLFFNSIIINIMNNTYHIHHWIIFLIVFLMPKQVVKYFKLGIVDL